MHTPGGVTSRESGYTRSSRGLQKHPFPWRFSVISPPFLRENVEILSLENHPFFSNPWRNRQDAGGASMLGHFYYIEVEKWRIMLKQTNGILKNHEKFSTNTPSSAEKTPFLWNSWRSCWKTPPFSEIHGPCLKPANDSLSPWNFGRACVPTMTWSDPAGPKHCWR